MLLASTGAHADTTVRPTYACFSPQNAAVIGRLGAGNPSVRYGFESGECLALVPGTRVMGVERAGNLWRFRALGAEPYLYAADWSAGFVPATGSYPPGFEQFIPVTNRLIAMGRRVAECFETNDRLKRWGDDLERRWQAYWTRRGQDLGISMVVVLHFSDDGPRLVSEVDRYKREEAMMHRTCSGVAQLEADQDFIAFSRTAQFG
jgi:hypothetical protein